MRISKGKVVFGKRDMWNFDNTISKVIHDGLVQFKKVGKNSYPPTFVEVTPDHKDLGNYSDEECNKEWERIFDVMIDGFKEHPEFYDVYGDSPTYNNLMNPEKFTDDENAPYKDEKGNILYNYHSKPKEGYTQEDVDLYIKKMREYHQEINDKIKLGREYFAKYLGNLWW